MRALSAFSLVTPVALASTELIWWTNLGAVNLRGYLGGGLSISFIAVTANERQSDDKRGSKQRERFLKAEGVHREESLINKVYDGRKAIIGSQDVKKINWVMLGSLSIVLPRIFHAK